MPAGEPNGGDTVLSALHGRFPALRSRDFRLMWIGQTVSVAGGQMQSVALHWHIYLLTGSPLALGMIGLARVIPIIVFSMIGGVVADAHDRRRVLFATQTSLALVAATLAAFTYYGKITAGGIYALTALSAAAMAFNNPARQALMPNLVPREHFSNATSLSSITHQVASIVGPILAAPLMAKGMLAAIYGINALSFGAVILSLFAIRPQVMERPSGEEVRLSWAAVKEGLGFVRRSEILVRTIQLDFLATFFSSANALLPVFAKDVLRVGEYGYSLLAAAPGIGSLLAGGIMAWMPTVRRQGKTVIWAVVVYGFATVVFGASTWFWVSWIALAATGASDTVSTILRQTIRQLVTPDHLRGRMTAATMVFFMGGPQLGELEAGIVASAIGPPKIGAPWSVVIGGIGCLLSTAWVAARSPTLRRYTDKSHDE